jgi:hypothetical protein
MREIRLRNECWGHYESICCAVENDQAWPLDMNRTTAISTRLSLQKVQPGDNIGLLVPEVLA